MLLGCGLRLAELTQLTVNHLQQRDNHWAIIDLFGKGGWLIESVLRIRRIVSNPLVPARRCFR